MSEDEKKPRGFASAFKSAEKIAHDDKATDKVLRDAEQKAKAQGERLREVSQDLHTLFRLIAAWSKGNYKKVPIQTILFAIAAVVYFVNPFDALPDYIPFLGYIDDITLVGFVVRSIRSDIREFLVWEKHT